MSFANDEDSMEECNTMLLRLCINSNNVQYLHHKHLLKLFEWINLFCFGANDLTVVFNSHLLQGLKQQYEIMRTWTYQVFACSEIQFRNFDADSHISRFQAGDVHFLQTALWFIKLTRSPYTYPLGSIMGRLCSLSGRPEIAQTNLDCEQWANGSGCASSLKESWHTGQLGLRLSRELL